MIHTQLNQLGGRALRKYFTVKGPMMFWWQTEETCYDDYEDRQRESKNGRKIAIDFV